MYGKKVKLRAFFVSLIFFSLVLIAFLIFKSLEENVVYFKSPTDVKNLPELNLKKIRVGGMVKKDSIQTFDNQIKFIITDFKNELFVSFNGSLPNLFEEGKGVVAEGFLEDRNYLNAEKILAKHDENYMPPEIAESLKDKN
tara:strand:- start:537 stop:959 length:423 start_codon:yes stop_codon:yes gene_type:complete